VIGIPESLITIPETAITMPGIGDHDRPESLIRMARNTQNERDRKLEAARESRLQRCESTTVFYCFLAA
jgi:hypothetical protein